MKKQVWLIGAILYGLSAINAWGQTDPKEFEYFYFDNAADLAAWDPFPIHIRGNSNTPGWVQETTEDGLPVARNNPYDNPALQYTWYLRDVFDVSGATQIEIKVVYRFHKLNYQNLRLMVGDTDLLPGDFQYESNLGPTYKQSPPFSENNSSPTNTAFACRKIVVDNPDYFLNPSNIGVRLNLRKCKSDQGCFYEEHQEGPGAFIHQIVVMTSDDPDEELPCFGSQAKLRFDQDNNNRIYFDLFVFGD